MTQTRLSAQDTALLIIDVQEKLAAAMPPEVIANLLRNTQVLVDAATRFKLPILVSEQYPKGLGRTVEPLAAALETARERGAAVHTWDKVEFSAAASAGFGGTAKRWLVCGMETHVCVYQTVRDLLARGAEVQLVSDAACSRTKANYRVGVGLAREAGALVTSTEVIVFDLLERAGGDDFKALSKAIR
ncbi:MAG: isochorismatase family protein [Deltaproteobacteria bacterium]|nr:isochorismatase family protein [Deltaproteobacteria bacterium]MCW5806096.1 isochorismatase family protein [Deltaproteobacteria bacterium]